MKKFLILILTCVSIGYACATPIDTYEFKSEANQKKALSIARSLRCPQCQNQDLVDSNADLAKELRLEVYQMVDNGLEEKEIIDLMVSRYNDFILYDTKLDKTTYILWFGPIILLVIGLIVGISVISRSRKEDNEETLSESERLKLKKLLKDNK